MKDRWKQCVTWISCFFILLYVPQTAAAYEEMELYARSAVLMDGDSGRILYGRGEDTPMPMASTTKIMTCIVALEQAELDMICTVSENAAAQPKVKLGMIKGDTFYLEDLLYSLMLESHNDTAVCIAEAVGGSVQGFADRMNQKAAQIGCENTYYITPNGLDAQDARGEHHTTAEELALVMRYCLRQSECSGLFLKITRAASHTFTNVAGSRNYSCTNHNALLTILKEAVSGKTGFTGKAGYCYIGAAQRDGRLLIVSLLACGWPNNKGYKWVDTKKLVKYGFENFEKRLLVEQPQKTADICVSGGSVPSVATAVDYAGTTGKVSNTTVLMQPGEPVEVCTKLAENLQAPVQKGQEVGRVSYLVGGTVYAQYPVVAREAVPVWNYTSCLRELIHRILFLYTG